MTTGLIAASILAALLTLRWLADHLRGIECIFAWVNSGHPVERDGRPVAQVHSGSPQFGRLLRKSARQARP